MQQSPNAVGLWLSSIASSPFSARNLVLVRWEFSNACMYLFPYSFAKISIKSLRISTQILSHHVDDFTLVSAFFLFALGCLNMLLGLIFRESAKAKRSITSWRAEAKGILPTSADKRPVFVNATPIVSSMFSQEKGQQVYVSHETVTDAHSFKSTEKAGYGFGRQGEKVAGLRGFILQKPEESLPRYASPTPPRAATLSRSPSSVSSSSSFYADERPPSMPPSHTTQAHAATPAFRSSPTSI
jgi:hypothetical protein